MPAWVRRKAEVEAPQKLQGRGPPVEGRDHDAQAENAEAPDDPQGDSKSHGIEFHVCTLPAAFSLSAVNICSRGAGLPHGGRAC